MRPDSTFLNMLSLPFFLILLLLCPAGAAEAEVGYEVSYEYYDVEIPEDGQVARAMLESTPINIHGKKFGGKANYQILFQYNIDRESSDICKLGQYTITVPCIITLPKIKSADPDMERYFASYQSRLKQHELTHCSIAKEHAEKFEHSLKAYRSVKCDEIRDKLKSAYQKALDDNKSAQSRYDHNTQHGRWEGANIGKETKRFIQHRENREKANTPAPGGPGLKSLDEKAAGGTGIYRDKDGTWRNH